MAHKDNTRFAQMALNLKMIDVAQFDEIMDLWKKAPTRDTGKLLLDKGFITSEQYQRVFSMLAGEKGGATAPSDESIYTDHFTLKGLLGQGGIGRVFIGFDKNIRREVAIKELISDQPDKDKDTNMARFVREAKITGQLEHPGIVPVYELDKRPDGTSFYVMKYVHGRTLFESILGCRADTEEEAFQKRIKLLGNLISVLEAMGYAHSKGVIHRDLKPSNIILGEFGETIILDWGLAKKSIDDNFEEPCKVDIEALEDDGDSMLTKQGELLGTPSYMAPEQIDPKFGRVDAQTDVYTLGIILFMLLTGKKPYAGRGKEVLKPIVSDDPSPSPRSYGSFIPHELAAICEKAMSKDKKERFMDANEFLAELKAYRDGRLVSIYAYSKGELLRRFIAHNKLALSAITAVVIAIVIGSGFAVHFAVEAEQARESAENTLVDVMGLSKEATSLATMSVGELERYFHKNKNEVRSTEMRKIIHEALSFDPLKSAYQVWVMNEKGKIIYDEDEKQMGLFLFTDATYARFPELLQLGERMRREVSGVGYYRFHARENEQVIYKIAAWDTFTPTDDIEWKIVVTYPYTVR